MLQLWWCWVFVTAHGLSLVVAIGGYSALWRSGFSCGGAQALNPRTSVAAVHGLSNCGAQA